MTVSIIIATYNRAHLLFETLQNLLNSFGTDLIESGAEIIIIDNNSADDTYLVAQRFSQSHPVLIKCYLETNQGLSFARNRGIAEAKNEVLIFVDDDIEFHHDWFREITSHFTNEKVGMVGGKMLPFNVGLPEWLPQTFYYLVGVVDMGDDLRTVREISGGNIAIRAVALQVAGLFDVNLGRIGSKLLGGEEVELSIRMRNSGYDIIYDPNAIVYHKIGNKLNAKYILDFAFLAGISDRVIDKKHRIFKYIVKYIYSSLKTVLSSSLNKNELNPRVIRYLYLKGYANVHR